MYRSLWWVIKTQYQTAKLAFVWRIAYGFYSGSISIVSTFAAAKVISSVSEAALNQGSPRPVYLWMVVIVAIEIVGTLTRNFDNLINARAEQKLELVVNERYFNKLYDLSQEQFENEEFNTKVNRAQDSLMKLWRVMNEITWTLSSLVRFVVSIVAVLVISPGVGLLIIATVVPSIFLRIKQNKLIEDANKKADPIEKVGYRTRWRLADPQDMAEIRMLNGLKRLVRIWKDSTKKAQGVIYEADKKSVKFSVVSDVMQPMVEFIANIIFFRLLLNGVIKLDKFIFLRGIMEQASTSALSLANSFETLHKLSIDLQNFTIFMDTPPAIPNGAVAVKRPLTIEFKDVNFKYPTASTPTLHDISFVIHPGSRIALVGENGAGKSTLIKLILRQYLPTSGQILVNGTDIKDVDQVSYYAALSVLSQEFLTFYHLTIKDNLALGRAEDVTDKDLDWAAGLVGATEFIDKLPHKFDTRLDTSFKDGSNLSGGQVQRLGVARALLRGGDIMVLDEPTSAIDAKAEYNIFNNIYQAHAGRTTLIVSHRFSTVRKADKVIVMEEGKIIEYGSHEELIAYNGLYKEMFELQAEGYR